MEFFAQFLAAIASTSNIAVVIVIAVIIGIGIIVYFKYIKPAFINFVSNQKRIESTSIDISLIKKAAMAMHSEDSKDIQGLLKENNVHLIKLSETVLQMRELINELSKDIQAHDRSHRDKLTDMLVELNKLSIRLENGIIHTRGIK